MSWARFLAVYSILGSALSFSQGDIVLGRKPLIIVSVNKHPATTTGAYSPEVQILHRRSLERAVPLEPPRRKACRDPNAIVYKGIACPYSKGTCKDKPTVQFFCYEIELNQCNPPPYVEAKWFYIAEYNSETDAIFYQRYSDPDCTQKISQPNRDITGKSRSCIGPLEKTLWWASYVKIVVRKPVRPNNAKIYTSGSCVFKETSNNNIFASLFSS